MKLYLNQLAEHLDKTFPHCILVSGDETMLVNTACDTIRNAAKKAGYSERVRFQIDTQFDWQQLRTAFQTLSLFSDKKLIECHIPSGKPGVNGAKILSELAETKSDNNALCIVTNKLTGQQQKSRWVIKITQHGAFLPIWPLEAGQLPNWIINQMAKHAIRLSRDAAEYIATSTQGNLLATQQEIEKLSLHYDAGTQLALKDIQASVIDSARFTVFECAEAFIQNNTAQYWRSLTRLQEEGTQAPLIIWALANDVRTLAEMSFYREKGETVAALLKRFKIWPKRAEKIRQCLEYRTANQWQDILQSLALIDEAAKGQSTHNPWKLLAQLPLGSLCQVA